MKTGALLTFIIGSHTSVKRPRKHTHDIANVPGNHGQQHSWPRQLRQGRRTPGAKSRDEHEERNHSTRYIPCCLPQTKLPDNQTEIEIYCVPRTMPQTSSKGLKSGKLPESVSLFSGARRSAKSVSRSTVRVTFSEIMRTGGYPSSGRAGCLRVDACVAMPLPDAGDQWKPSPTRTMMSMKEMPVAAGIQWKAKASSSELEEYETRKNSVHAL